MRRGVPGESAAQQLKLSPESTQALLPLAQDYLKKAVG
jgi:hypothetical protein